MEISDHVDPGFSLDSSCELGSSCERLAQWPASKRVCQAAARDGASLSTRQVRTREPPNSAPQSGTWDPPAQILSPRPLPGAAYLPAPKRNHGPQKFHDPKGPRALHEAIRGGSKAGSGERHHEPGRPRLQRIEDEHR